VKDRAGRGVFGRFLYIIYAEGRSRDARRYHLLQEGKSIGHRSLIRNNTQLTSLRSYR
jgi:hypothetical protein